jgi:hypothetical protein
MTRNHIIVGGAVIVAIIIGALAFLYSSRNVSNALPSTVTENNPMPIAVPFTELAHGTQSTVSTRINYLITTTEGLQKLWKMIDAKGSPPTVDFSKNAVAAVFAGEKPTAGYAITVSHIEDTTVRMVTVMLSEPDGNCPEKKSIIAPYELVMLSTTTLSVTHQDIVATTSCPQS